MAEKKEDHSKEKETRKAVTEDVEKFFRDVWGKVVEYASLGAEEATKLSATAKTRVDVETLKFKRGKIIKMLGERYLDLCEKDPSLVVKGTTELLGDIRKIDREINSLEREMTRAKKTEKKKTAKAPAGKSGSKKAPARKKPAPKKAPSTKTAARKTPASGTAGEVPKTPETKE